MAEFDLSSLLDTENSLERHGLIVERIQQLDLRANVPHLKCHSNGFECGYSGSGPADLALAVLHALIPPPDEEAEDALYQLPHDQFMEADEDPSLWSEKVGPDLIRVNRLAWQLHQSFKSRFIATMPREGGFVAIAQIRGWIDEATRQLKERTSS